MSKTKKISPPFFAELIMKYFFPDYRNYTTVGDLQESFYYEAKEKGVFKAKWWYRKEVVKSVAPLFFHSFFGGMSMFQNYIKVTFRNLINHKLFSIINISGLAIGIACCAAILQYIRFETSFDKYHKNAENIYRVYEENNNESVVKYTANTFAPVAPALEIDFPQIESVVRIFPFEVTVSKNDQVKFQENKFFFVDSTMFNVFDYEFIWGDENNALQNPYSIILTESSAIKYFGNQNPVGQILHVEGEYDFAVAAVIKDVPENSHFTFDMLASISSMRDFMSWALKSWHYPPVYTYALMPENYDISQIEQSLEGFVTKHIGYKEAREIHLQPMTDIHLYSDMENEIGTNSSIEYIYLLTGIALFILLIACVNFMNLTTARSEKRAKEIGLRKVIGAKRKSIMMQFFGEAMFYSFAALFTAVLLIEIIKKPFNEIVGRNIRFDYINDIPLTAGFIILALLVGMISGSYPALFFSGFSPIDTLKSNTPLRSTKGPALFRKFLVGFQFVTSFILIMASFVISNQIDFIKNKKLGFNSEQTIIIPVKDEVIQQNIKTVQESLLFNSAIMGVTAASSIPGIDREIVFPINAEGMKKDEEVSFKTIITDENFINTLKIKIADGRNFDKTFSTDKDEGFIINETAAKELGWENPVGKKLTMKHVIERKNKSGKIVGVVKDFHWRSMHFKIDPLILQIANLNYFYDYLAVKVAPNKIEEALSILESKWNEVVPHRVFQYSFLDEKFAQLFKSEQKLFKVFVYASGIALFIACLGLFGLMSFITQQRSKEIGIRKVLGASTSNIAILLSFDFMKPLLAASLFGLPVSYLFLNNWLNDFAYRTNISVSVIIFSLLLLFLVAVVSVGYQAFKAALDNPVNSIRSK